MMQTSGGVDGPAPLAIFDTARFQLKLRWTSFWVLSAGALHSIPMFWAWSPWASAAVAVDANLVSVGARQSIGSSDAGVIELRSCSGGSGSGGGGRREEHLLIENDACDI